MKSYIFRVLAILWMVVIFWFSSCPAEESGSMSHSVGYTIGKLVIPDFENLPEQKQAAFADRIDYPVRKAAHVTEFAILGFLLAGSVFGSSGRQLTKAQLRNLSAAALAVGFAYACSDEIHQIFVPGRAGRFSDVLIDSAGVLLGIVAFRLLRRFCRRINRSDA